MPSLRGSVAFAGLLAFGAQSAVAAGEVVAHARRLDGPRLLVEEGRYRLDSGDRTREIELPLGARVDALESLGSGWLLAGSVREAAAEELLLVRGDAQGETSLPAPPGRTGLRRRTPVPFVAGGELVGVAWLEGDGPRTFDVRFAAWNGDRFGAPEVVAPRGPGSQLALTGSRLADGRLLLAWAGFDGRDDEVWYSLGGAASEKGRTWTQPARVADDNETPDITPVAATSGDGALVAWSRYDGSEYRLMTARFDGETMRDARFAAPPGTLDPTIEAAPSGLAVLYFDAGREAWTIAELTRDGSLGRRAAVAGENARRPSVGFEAGKVVWSSEGRRTVSPWQ